MASWLTPFFPCCVNRHAAPLKLDPHPANRPGVPLNPSRDEPLEPGPGRPFVLLFPLLPGEAGLVLPLVAVLSSADNKQDSIPKTRASPIMHSKAAMVQFDSESSGWEFERDSVGEDKSKACCCCCCCLDLLADRLRVNGEERLRWEPGRRTPVATATIKLGSEMMRFEGDSIKVNQIWETLNEFEFGDWDDREGRVNEFRPLKRDGIGIGIGRNLVFYWVDLFNSLSFSVGLKILKREDELSLSLSLSLRNKLN